MKTFIKISTWVLIIFGFLFLTTSIILAVAGMIRLGNPGGANRVFLARLPILFSSLTAGLLLIGLGEIIHLLLHIDENTEIKSSSKNVAIGSSIKKK